MQQEDITRKLQESMRLVTEYQEKIFDRFKDYVLGVSILPPRKEEPDVVSTLILIDDTGSKKLSKEELKEKLYKLFSDLAKDYEKLKPEILLLTELWQHCYDAKYDILSDIAMSTPTYDRGILQAIRLVEVHKRMVLEKFEKYIVSYVLGGSLVQGTATTKSDVDVFIIIDDTDVKRMTRAELRDKLRAIIIDQGYQAGEITNVRNKINIQVYILTDFWDYVKEANPVIFTFLRDGVPFYDKGLFMPWKQLLRMGKIRPSKESIDQLMSYGDQYLKRVQLKLREIGVEDFFWATSTPSQAAIMMQGYPPPTPKELSKALKDLFVKEKLLEPEYVDIWDKIFKVRKDIEQGRKTSVTGSEIDELYTLTEKYVNRINKLFETIQKNKDLESVIHTYETTITMVRDVLKAEGIEVKDVDLVSCFDKELIKTGKLPEKFLRLLKDVIKAKESFEKKKLTPTQVYDVNKKGNELIKSLLEYIQRKRALSIEQSKLRVLHSDTQAELLLSNDIVYIIHDVKAENQSVSKAKLLKTGGLGQLKDASFEELEQKIADGKITGRLIITDALFNSIKELFGKDAKIVV